PERRTPAPRVQGPETAVVVGDGEIDCDEHGRILVRYHWDLDGAHSMRVRVSQNWASKGWGGMVIPRIGMEVIVEHLRGDPDKPIVTGCVYNGHNTPPYELPARKTASAFRSQSHKGPGFNELRFEDQTGEEEIMLRAQKDLTQKIQNNSTMRIDANHFTSIGHNSMVEVAGQATQHVGGDFTLSVSGSNRETFATGEVAKHWEGVRKIGYLIGRGKSAMQGVGNLIMNAVGTIYLSARKNAILDAGADVSISAGNDRTDTVARDRMDQTRRNSRTSVGKTQRVEVGKKLKVTVGEEIEFRCGDALIQAQSDGTINIKGSHIIINGSRIDLN
ncbi:type VI secretion system Vgr family protein, partial [Tritonibacter multivorans]